jgi:hypothetical protein
MARQFRGSGCFGIAKEDVDRGDVGSLSMVVRANE